MNTFDSHYPLNNDARLNQTNVFQQTYKII